MGRRALRPAGHNGADLLQGPLDEIRHHRVLVAALLPRHRVLRHPDHHRVVGRMPPSNRCQGRPHQGRGGLLRLQAREPELFGQRQRVLLLKRRRGRHAAGGRHAEQPGLGPRRRQAQHGGPAGRRQARAQAVRERHAPGGLWAHHRVPRSLGDDGALDGDLHQKAGLQVVRGGHHGQGDFLQRHLVPRRIDVVDEGLLQPHRQMGPLVPQEPHAARLRQPHRPRHLRLRLHLRDVDAVGRDQRPQRLVPASLQHPPGSYLPHAWAVGEEADPLR
mmetsp:Transcript_71012/g.230518  ORF Transcript_71012/g.230518 Transcript_71012/m.230518 type:complete len:275 (+) Transcript_71012:3132-3956(+)